MKSKRYYVYLLTNRSRTLYVGVTNSLERRMAEHAAAGSDTFCGRYNIRQLVCLEEYDDVNAAIAREKQIKSWRREKKIALIEAANPDWSNLWDGR